MFTRLYHQILFAAAAVLLFFFMMHHIPLWSSDEGRYGEIAREMLESGNFIVPHFNHMLFLDKPVLAPVVTAFSMSVFGVNSFGARLPIAIAALGGIAATWFFTRRIFDRLTADLSALLLTTTIGYVLVGRFAVIEMIMCLWLTLIVFCLMAGYFEKKPRYYLLAYFFAGLAFLTKGLTSLAIPGLLFFLFLIWQKKLSEIKRAKLVWGIILFLAVASPWVIAIAQKVPEFMHEFFVEQHFNRFLTGSFGRRRPFWFYIPLFFALALPWSLFVPSSILYGLRKNPEQREKVRFLICWLFAILFFFSLPKSKLPYYILPVSIPAAILTAHFFANWIRGKDTQAFSGHPAFAWIWKIIPVLPIGAFIGINIYLVVGKKMMAEVHALQNMLEAGLIVMAVMSVMAYLSYRKNRAMAAILLLAGMVYTGLGMTAYGMKVISPLQSNYELTQLIKPKLGKEDVVGFLGSPDRFSDIPFYLERRVMVIGPDRGTLTEQSLKRENMYAQAAWFPSMEEFSKLFSDKSRPAYCFVPAKDLEWFKKNGFKDFTLIKKQHKILLLTNQESFN